MPIRKSRSTPTSKAPTIRQVAEAAGVSVASVSRALAGSTLVKPELRERVEAAARNLNYHPNRVARNLRKQTTRMVAVVVTDIESPFFTGVMRGVERVLRPAGYSLILANSDEDEALEWEHLMNLRAEGVAGVILAPTAESGEQYEQFHASGPAMVCIDRAPENFKIDRVTVNNLEGAQAAARHLIEQGHRAIGMIAGIPRISTAYQRQLGYEQAMRAAGLTARPEWVQVGDFRPEGGYRAMRALLDLPADRRPTAVITSNNQMTLGALPAIYERGLNIPNDVALVGFDDMPWASSLNPPLTAVAQPAQELGAVAAQLLLDRLAQRERPFRHVLLDTQLIVRASSARSARSADDPGI